MGALSFLDKRRGAPCHCSVVYGNQDVDTPPRGPGGGPEKEDGGQPCGGGGLSHEGGSNPRFLTTRTDPERDACSALSRRKAKACERAHAQTLETDAREQTDKRAEAEATGAGQGRGMVAGDESARNVRI